MREYDYSKLRGRIREKCGTEKEFASKIGRSAAFLSCVFSGKMFFRQEDIANSVEVLQIPQDEVGEYFFCVKGSQM